MSETTTTSIPPSGTAHEAGTTDQAKQKAAEVASSARESAGQVVDQAREQAGVVASETADQIGQVVGTVRQELRARASDEATNLGDRLGEVAAELRAMSQASSEHGGTAAGLVSGVAAQVDRSARRLRDGDLDTTLEDVKWLARNRPGAFLLGALGAGFVVGRLLRQADLKEIGQAANPSTDDGSTANGLPSASAGTSRSSGGGAVGPGPSVPDPFSRPTPDPTSSPTTPLVGETF